MIRTLEKNLILSTFLLVKPCVSQVVLIIDL